MIGICGVKDGIRVIQFPSFLGSFFTIAMHQIMPGWYGHPGLLCLNAMCLLLSVCLHYLYSDPSFQKVKLSGKYHVSYK